MAGFNNILKQAQDLVNDYLKLQKQKKLLEDEILSLKEKISTFSGENNIKTLKSGNTLLYVSKRSRTVFPKVGEKGREQIEDIMRKSEEWKHSITFDIVKLAYSYDKKKLSQNLMRQLEPFARKEESIRISTRDISQNLTK